MDRDRPRRVQPGQQEGVARVGGEQVEPADRPALGGGPVEGAGGGVEGEAVGDVGRGVVEGAGRVAPAGGHRPAEQLPTGRKKARSTLDSQIIIK